MDAHDHLLDEILVDAHGEDEQLWAMAGAFGEAMDLPADGFVVGQPVSVLGIDYGGQLLRGLVARCRDGRGEEHEVALADVVFHEGTAAARHVGAYRRWMGLEPLAAPAARQQHKAEPQDIESGRTTDLVVLGVMERAARCRLLGTERVLTLRAADLDEVAPGQIVTVDPRKQWRYGNHPYLSGEIQSARIDIPALGLVPLKLEDWGSWDPAEPYWGEPDEPRRTGNRRSSSVDPAPSTRWSRCCPAPRTTTGTPT